MKTQRKRLAYTSCLVACVALSLTASGQDLDLWDINVDVDRDGIVGPTDIQQVINGALGIRNSGPEALDLPVRQYVVASPRASLLPVRRLQDVADGECATQGAAFNFPRPRGRILARQGTMIIFRYDRNTEGVWYDDACGLLRSDLWLEMRRAHFPEDEVEHPDDPTAEKQVSGNGGEDDGTSDEEPVWIPLGHDAAEGKRCGPAVGTANIGVRYLFEHPGDYLVRATIVTTAVPEPPVLEPAIVAPDCGQVRRADQVFVAIRIVDRDDTDVDFRWQEIGQADEVHQVFGDIFRHDRDPDVVYPE